MQATFMQLDSGPKTLQMFVAAHWQYEFTTSGGVECVCCAWANVCGIPWVARPPRNSEALVLGTYSFVYDVDDEMGASRGREKHPCFYDASGGF